MEIYINIERLKGFLIDGEGNVKAPMYFSTSDEIGEAAKEVFIIFAGYCLRNETLVIPGRECQQLIDEEFPLNKRTMLAIVELKQNGFIDIT